MYSKLSLDLYIIFAVKSVNKINLVAHSRDLHTNIKSFKLLLYDTYKEYNLYIINNLNYEITLFFEMFNLYQHFSCEAPRRHII